MQDDDDDVVEERDPSGRFARYDQKVGKGRFKCVYKGFDEKQGIDIAWSKVLQVRSTSRSRCHRWVSMRMYIASAYRQPAAISC